MLVSPVGVEVVKSELSRHELVGIDKDEDDDWMLSQKGIELLFGSEILHDSTNNGMQLYVVQDKVD